MRHVSLVFGWTLMGLGLAVGGELDAAAFKSLIVPGAIEKAVTLVDGRPDSEVKSGQYSRCVEFFKDGKKVGARGWHLNGVLAYEDVYVDGKQDGASHEWAEGGWIWIRSFYKDGQLHGETTEWYKNGIIKQTEAFWKGKIHGIARKWDSNGKRETEFGEAYRDGRRIGFYNVLGQRVTREEYVKAAEKDATLGKLEAGD